MYRTEFSHSEGMPGWAMILAIGGLILLFALAIWLSFSLPAENLTGLQYP